MKLEKEIYSKLQRLDRTFHKITAKESKIIWNEETEEAFDQLERVLPSIPALWQPDFTKPFYIVTDSSTVGIAGYLGQRPTEEKDIIKYVSRTLKPNGMKYGVSKLECFDPHHTEIP